MFTKIQHAYDKSVDLVLAVWFKFWVWQMHRLGVQITLTPESQAAINELLEENLAPRAEAVSYANLISNGEHIKGEDRPNRKKLTQTEVQDIRSMKRMGITQAQLADIYDVNPATISRIVRNQYYRKVAA